jgi:hypothetical protein
MHRYLHVLLTGAASIAFITGCTSPQIDVAIVNQTLQTYQPGKTTFKDFKKDAGLIVVERPAPDYFNQHSYLNPQPAIPYQAIPKTQTNYDVPAGSPWKIYETGQSVSFINGKFSQAYKFAVGDINHPISILAFDGHGNLTSISPIP